MVIFHSYVSLPEGKWSVKRGGFLLENGDFFSGENCIVYNFFPALRH